MLMILKRKNSVIVRMYEEKYTSEDWCNIECNHRDLRFKGDNDRNIWCQAQSRHFDEKIKRTF